MPVGFGAALVAQQFELFFRFDALGLRADAKLDPSLVIATQSPFSASSETNERSILIVSSLDLNPRLQTGRGFSRFFVHRLTP